MAGVSLSQVFRDLDAQPEERFRLDAIVSATGSRMHGIALLVLALPDAIPIPIPSVSAILGLPLLVVCAHLCLYGDAAALPERVARVEISHRVIHFLAGRVSPILGMIEAFCRPRFSIVLSYQRALGLVALYLTLILLLPIPLLNTPPALCIVAIGLGLVQRDGLVALIGVAGTVVLTGGLVALADSLYALAS